MGIVIRVIFRELPTKKKLRHERLKRSSVARQRGLTLWHARDDLAFAAVYRTGPAAAPQPASPTLQFAPQA